MFRLAPAVIAVLSPLAFAGPVKVTLSGNFGVPSGTPTVFDNQDYSVTYTIADPHFPDAFFDAPGGLGQIEAIYDVQAVLSVPGIGFSVASPVEVQYVNQAPLGLWMNIGVFRPLPVGDFLIMTPFQTPGAPLWNGLAGARGTPDITLLTNQAGSARWFLEQSMLPLAFYGSGTAAITAAPVAPVPEPSTAALAAGSLFALACLRWRIGRTPRPRQLRGAIDRRQVPIHVGQDGILRRVVNPIGAPVANRRADKLPHKETYANGRRPRCQEIRSSPVLG